MNEMVAERDDEFFDFSEQVLGDFTKEPMNTNPTDGPQPFNTDNKTEVHTSYILVNALLTLLVRKGVIYSHEVNALVAELHSEYMKKRGKDE
jgi:hypothetical protein